MDALNLAQPVAPAAGYLGAKHNLTSRLVTMIERVDHEG